MRFNELCIKPFAIKHTRWWERILLWFVRPYRSVDITKDGAYWLETKWLFGRIHIIREWYKEWDERKGL